jgi:hypothetical protein
MIANADMGGKLVSNQFILIAQQQIILLGGGYILFGIQSVDPARCTVGKGVAVGDIWLDIQNRSAVDEIQPADVEHAAFDLV